MSAPYQKLANSCTPFHLKINHFASILYPLLSYFPASFLNAAHSKKLFYSYLNCTVNLFVMMVQTLLSWTVDSADLLEGNAFIVLL